MTHPEYSGPVRVTHVITDLEIGGAETSLLRLLEILDPAHVESSVVSLSSKGVLGRRIEEMGIRVEALGMRPGRFSPKTLLRLIGLLRTSKPDVVQTWLYHADLVGFIAATIARIPDVVWNIRCADLDSRDHPRSLGPLRRLLAILSGRTSAIVCNSLAGQQAHERLGYTSPRWRIIPNGFDVDAFRPSVEASRDLRKELGLREDVPLVGLLARVHPMKDHENFLRAARVVADARPEVRFVAAGRGVDSSSRLTELVARLGLRERVYLLPERRDPHRFLAGIDVAVSASYSEAFPNVVGEAMACGTACVVTDVGDSRALVGDAGRVVPSRQPLALGNGILEMLGMDQLSRAAVSRASRHRIATEFSVHQTAMRYQELYESLMASRSTHPANQVCAE